MSGSSQLITYQTRDGQKQACQQVPYGGIGLKYNRSEKEIKNKNKNVSAVDSARRFRKGTSCLQTIKNKLLGQFEQMV